MGLAGALGIAPKVQLIEFLDKGLIDVALKGGRKAHGLILERTVTGPEGCLQCGAFISVLPRILFYLARPRQSRDSPDLGK